MAQLSLLGFEGFEEREESLLAYAASDAVDLSEVNDLCASLEVSFTYQTIPITNWNAAWESNFEPVRVGDFLSIRAAFHSPQPAALHELIITPKMSFGTGHHATTQLMVQLMSGLDFANSSVFDFGTGTGVLAILASKLGARQVLAIDNDEWSTQNALENTQVNQCANITVMAIDHPPVTDDRFDIILANINKSVLLDTIPRLAILLQPQGKLLLSGLLTEDQHDILEKTGQQGLQCREIRTEKGWIALLLSY